MSSKTVGVIIKRQNFAEADRILTIFTEDLGKIKAIARGVRKISAKLAGSLEPFMLIEFQLYEGRTFYTVTGAIIREEFAGIHTDLKRTAEACYIGELIDKFEHEHQRSPAVFELLRETLQLLDQTFLRDLILPAFEVKLLKLAGLWGNLTICLHCRKRLELAKNYFDGEEGGVICNSCHLQFHHGYPISNDGIKLLRLLESCHLSDLERIKSSLELKRETVSILRTYLRRVLESNVRSESFLEELIK